MKILITGAHFTPAVATIEQLKKIKDAEVVYVGRKNTQEGDGSASVESTELPALGVKFIPIITGRLQRDFTIHTIPSLLKIPIGFLQALFIILSEKPDVILSFGGYVAVPVVIAGWLFSVPIIIHEQTLVMGLANKICSYFADKIAVSFKKDDFKNEKVILTGNPVRHEIMQKSPGAKLVHLEGGQKGGQIVLIMGGNQGSHAINLAVEEGLSKLLKLAFIYHQTGSSKYKDYERLKNLEDLEKRYTVKKWIGKEYGAILQKADLIVCRAGINTLTELAFLGKPALLIPIPNKEQRTNAKYFEQLGLVKILSQPELSGQTLVKNIRLMLSNLRNLKEKAGKTKQIIIYDGAKRLALETMLLAI